MTGGINRLSTAKVRSARKPGRYGDGGGLSLRVRPNGNRAWVFRYHVPGVNDKGERVSKSRDVGLGSAETVGLAAARELAKRCREAWALGIDPATVVRPAKARTFLDVARETLDHVGLDGMAKASRRQWERSALETFAPLHRKAVAQITTDDALSVLRPQWERTPETARRDRMRLERIMGYAIARGWHDGPNPARWKAHLDTLLQRHGGDAKGHHYALPYQEGPALAAWLAGQQAMSARLAEFILFSALRTSEAREAQWGEVDLGARVLRIPAERMKNRKPFTVPLEGRALQIMADLSEARVSDMVFPGQKAGRPLSLDTARKFIKEGYDARLTIHGLRSSFRDFAGDRTQARRETAEAALSHRLGSSEELAYRRGDALAKRRALMRQWADYLQGKGSADVVELHGL